MYCGRFLMGAAQMLGVMYLEGLPRNGKSSLTEIPGMLQNTGLARVYEN